MLFPNSPNQNKQPADRGQATVEFALVLPLLTICLLLLAQLLIIVLAHVQVINTARNAVRAAAVSLDPAQAAEIAGHQSSNAAIEIRARVNNDWVTVTVSQHLKTDAPIVGRFIGDLDISARFTMLREPPIG